MAIPTILGYFRSQKTPTLVGTPKSPAPNVAHQETQVEWNRFLQRSPLISVKHLLRRRCAVFAAPAACRRGWTGRAQCGGLWAHFLRGAWPRGEAAGGGLGRSCRAPCSPPSPEALRGRGRELAGRRGSTNWALGPPGELTREDSGAERRREEQSSPGSAARPGPAASV